MDREELVALLTARYGYPPGGARLVAQRLAASAPAVQAAFREWLENGAIPDLAVEGYTLSMLMGQHGMAPIAALLTLDWLLREPAPARASLAKGHDRAVRSGSP